MPMALLNMAELCGCECVNMGTICSNGRGGALWFSSLQFEVPFKKKKAF